MNTITEKLCTIQTLAIEISQANIAHVFCDYSGHVDNLTVYAHPADVEYQDGFTRERIIDDRIYLQADEKLLHRKLDHLIADLTALKQEAAA
ncbi:hypothetical protein ACFVYJ_01355 [Pontibacter sp. JAM-7]|uniref:hypothetical protein n=1 Tax=Pontibacter sp. JAM-7 TaxID=3366581 RepID=UPI003AF56A32